METFRVTTSFYIDSSWHRNTKGNVIFAGSPLRAFRLSQAGMVIADALERGEELANGHEQLTTRLLQAGAVHPHLSEALKPEDITIVIPAFVRDSKDMSTLQKLTAFFRIIPSSSLTTHPLCILTLIAQSSFGIRLIVVLLQRVIQPLKKCQRHTWHSLILTHLLRAINSAALDRSLKTPISESLHHVLPLKNLRHN